MANQTGILSEGARRVWRHQRVLWWFFVVNLVLAGLGTLPLASRVGQVANHSLASERLYRGFDVPTFLALANNPDVGLSANMAGSMLFALFFFFFALFLTGGILETYRANRKLTTGEFFQACGAFFWRWVRLLIFMLIVLTPITILAWGIDKWSGILSNEAPQEKLGFWVELGGLLFVTLVMMAVRLWFDMAQVRAVAEDERSMRWTFVRAFRLTFSNFGLLFWIYFRTSLLAWLGLALGLWLWLRIPAPRVGLSFLVFELVLLWWAGTRLWQRASETAWYQSRHAAPAVTLAPIAIPQPAPAPAAAPPEQG